MLYRESSPRHGGKAQEIKMEGSCAGRLPSGEGRVWRPPGANARPRGKAARGKNEVAEPEVPYFFRLVFAGIHDARPAYSFATRGRGSHQRFWALAGNFRRPAPRFV